MKQTGEPSVEALGGKGLGRLLSRYVLATRPKFLSAIALPVVLGTAWGALRISSFDATGFALALVASIAVAAGGNVINDVHDHLSGNDGLNDGRIHPYSGGSRFIQNGILSVGQMARWAYFLLAVGSAAGLLLTFHLGAPVLAFGAVGLALAVAYSAPPVKLSARGLGEIVVGLAFGLLPVVGAAWTQSGAVTVEAVLLALPTTFWVIAILLINEVPDATADAAVGRRTWVVIGGRRAARRLYLVLHGSALATFALGVANGLLPTWSLLGPAVLLGLAVRVSAAIDGADDDRLRRAMEFTLAIHGLGILWTCVAVSVNA